MHNSHLIGTLSRNMALQQYYNPAQPVNLLQNSLVNYTPAQGITEDAMRAPQLYGYSDNKMMNQRIANTISAYIPQTQTPLYQTNQTLNSMLPPDQQLVPVVAQPIVQPVQQIQSTQPQQQTTEQVKEPVKETPKESFQEPTVKVNSDNIVINKSTIVVIVCIIIAFIIVQIWLKQRYIETVLQTMEYKNKQVMQQSPPPTPQIQYQQTYPQSYQQPYQQPPPDFIPQTSVPYE